MLARTLNYDLFIHSKLPQARQSIIQKNFQIFQILLTQRVGNRLREYLNYVISYTMNSLLHPWESIQEFTETIRGDLTSCLKSDNISGFPPPDVLKKLGIKDT